MTEYIKREDVLKILSGKNAPWNGYVKCKELPADDVQPVKHGRWINTMPNVEYKSFCQVKCSICESIEAYGNYCRNCGADMRGE